MVQFWNIYVCIYAVCRLIGKPRENARIVIKDSSGSLVENINPCTIFQWIGRKQNYYTLLIFVASNFVIVQNEAKLHMQLPANMKWSIIDRWATHPLFIETIAERVKEELFQFPEDIRNDVLILFSAHSLPIKAVFRGDPYAAEVASTVTLVMEKLQYCNPYKLVWQSKVGPVSWLQPFTDDAIKAYVKQGKKHFILVPVAFVNEHIETLHELDIEYCKELAEELDIDRIRRTAAPNDHPKFIAALSDIVVSHLKSNRPISPTFLTRCPSCVNSNCTKSKNWYAQICKS